MVYRIALYKEPFDTGELSGEFELGGQPRFTCTCKEEKKSFLLEEQRGEREVGFYGGRGEQLGAFIQILHYLHSDKWNAKQGWGAGGNN